MMSATARCPKLARGPERPPAGGCLARTGEAEGTRTWQPLSSEDGEPEELEDPHRRKRPEDRARRTTIRGGRTRSNTIAASTAAMPAGLAASASREVQVHGRLDARRHAAERARDPGQHPQRARRARVAGERRQHERRAEHDARTRSRGRARRSRRARRRSTAVTASSSSPRRAARGTARRARPAARRSPSAAAAPPAGRRSGRARCTRSRCGAR